MKTLFFGLLLMGALQANAADSCYRLLVIGETSNPVLNYLSVKIDGSALVFTNDSGSGGEKVEGSCVDMFIDNRNGVNVMGQNVQVILHMGGGNPMIKKVMSDLVSIAGIKFEVTTANGASDLIGYGKKQ